ncbi:MAG: efflux RND transporter periplasmic adaptor subunit [Salibacteraceae bacterium]|nr:efflux RND transporter periplasmic adaptor subunit [Salibacteraceae bacterium]|tara:strand:- start:3225 stop:4391 length:1167 start_codon:yes stop_codon:yes gene_type:complete
MKNYYTQTSTKMKQITVFFIAALFMVSCDEKNGTDELSMLKQEKDSLKEVKSTIGDRLAEIELQISALDTTKSLALVSTAKPTVGAFNHYFQVYGSLSSDKNAQLYPEIGATINSIKVKEGQAVSKGQLLATLDIQSIREQEAELKTRMELAETTFKKQKTLWDQKIGSEMQFLQAKNNTEALKSSLASLQANIAKGNITAPFAGVVDEIFPKVGEMAMPGMPIVRLLNLTNMYVEADISENYVGKVKAGDNVVISFPSLGMEKKSKIERIGQFINPNNRTFKVRVNIDNSENILKPNMVALINVNDFSKDTAVVINSGLIMEGALDTKYVFVVTKKAGVPIVKKQLVQVTMSYQGKSMISKGLKGTETIVDRGARSIRSGEPVSIKN